LPPLMPLRNGRSHSVWDGSIIDVNANLTPSTSPTIYGPIIAPPPITYTFTGPDKVTTDLIDKLRNQISNLSGLAGGIQDDLDRVPIIPPITTYRDSGNGFDFPDALAGVGVGAIAALVLVLALGARK